MLLYAVATAAMSSRQSVSAVVDALALKDGDEIEIRIVGDRAFEVRRDQGRHHALVRLRKLSRPLPPGFIFDREDVNAR